MRCGPASCACWRAIAARRAARLGGGTVCFFVRCEGKGSMSLGIWMLFGKRKRIVKRILIVEDEPLIAFDNEVMLGDAGYEVVATLDGFDEAIALVSARAGRFDPQRRSAAARAAYRASTLPARPRNKGIPVLFASGHKPPDDAPEFALGCLMKPYSERQLRQALDSVERFLAGQEGPAAQGAALLRRRTGLNRVWSRADPLLIMACISSSGRMDYGGGGEAQGVAAAHGRAERPQDRDHARLRLCRGPALHLADRHAERLARRVARSTSPPSASCRGSASPTPSNSCGRRWSTGCGCRGSRSSGGGAAGCSSARCC